MPAPAYKSRHTYQPEPTAAEFEQFGRRMYHDLIRKRELLNQLAQVNSDMDQAVSEISRHGGMGLVEPCQFCNYDICQCERIG